MMVWKINMHPTNNDGLESPMFPASTNWGRIGVTLSPMSWFLGGIFPNCWGVIFEVTKNFLTLFGMPQKNPSQVPTLVVETLFFWTVYICIYIYV